MFVKLNVEFNSLPIDLSEFTDFPKIFLYLKDKKIAPILFKNKFNTVELNKFCNLNNYHKN